MPIVKANKKTIAQAAKIIKAGGIVAFPTETVYGLGANAFNARAVRKIFETKGRPMDNPLIVHIGEMGELNKISNFRPFGMSPAGGQFPNSKLRFAMTAEELAERFWPGPLTLVLPKNKNIPDEVTAGLRTVAVRMPSHPVARALIRAAGVPIAAPSANLSGRPSPTTALHVAEDFGDGLFILDGGCAEVGLESTVLDLTVEPPIILRQGAVTLEIIQGVLPETISCKGNFSTSAGGKVKSPGMKYRHYAPRAPLFLAQGKGAKEEIPSIQRFLLNHKNLRVGVLTVEEHKDRYQHAWVVISLGSRRNLSEIAQNLFTSLRKFDKLNVDVIIAETFPREGIGAAIMERLEKASYGDGKSR